MRERYVDMGMGIAVPLSAVLARPVIRKHIDGPLLTWAGNLHWLTPGERLAVFAGVQTAETLAQKHWPLRRSFADRMPPGFVSAGGGR